MCREAKGSGRNGAIDFYKFFYSWIIVGFHFYEETSEHFASGWYAVEFFLLVSGFYLFSKYESEFAQGAEKMTRPYSYLTNRFSAFFPGALIGYLMSAVVAYGIVSPIQSLSVAADYFSKDVLDVLLVSMNGINQGAFPLNAPAWTLSNMLLVQFILWASLYFYDKKFLSLFMPVSLIFGYGLLSQVGGTILWVGIGTGTMVRVWVAICTGYYSFCISKRLASKQVGTYQKALLTIVEIFCHVMAIILSCHRGSTNFWYCAILAWLIAIAITASGKTYTATLFCSAKLSSWMGKMSMSIFLCHNAALRLFLFLYQNPYERYSNKYFFVIFVLLLSILHQFFATGIVNVYKHLRRARS